MKPMRQRTILAAVLVSMAATTFDLREAGALEQAPASQKYLSEATKGIATLQSWYTTSTGLYQTTGWWNAANAITALVNYSRVSGSHQYLPSIANTLTAAQTTNKGFINNYYDDEGWWALAWINAYDLT